MKRCYTTDLFLIYQELDEYSSVVSVGDGYCRSEAIVAVYLQKSESAKRVYATLVHSKTNSDGYKDQGIYLVHNFIFIDGIIFDSSNDIDAVRANSIPQFVEFCCVNYIYHIGCC